jgi:hypothetical protein
MATSQNLPPTATAPPPKRWARLFGNTSPRAKSKLEQLLDRLDHRLANPFGDYTALLANYGIDSTGVISPNTDFITLHAVNGDNWLEKSYSVIPCRGHKNALFDKLPPGWPSPSIESLLPALGTTVPIESRILNGPAGWSTSRGKICPIDRRVRSSIPARFSLEGMFWPTRQSTGIGFPGVFMSLLHDPARPNLVGLHWVRENRDPLAHGNIVQHFFRRFQRPQLPTVRSEITTWLDTERDDLPVESFWTSADDNGNVHLTACTRYLEYAQLPTGQWFPTLWHEDRAQLDPRTHKNIESPGGRRLQIFPNLHLDPSWFQKPALTI